MAHNFSELANFVWSVTDPREAITNKPTAARSSFPSPCCVA